jgi:hypothetical protein
VKNTAAGPKSIMKSSSIRRGGLISMVNIGARGFRVFAITIILACGLAGCSLLYSYRNIDRYIRWSLDDYVTWDSSQESLLRTRVTSLLAWHKETQLPRYRSWLEACDRTLDGDIDVPMLAAALAQMQLFWQDTATHMQADLQRQIASMSNDQVLELTAALRSEQADLKDEYDETTLAALIKKRRREMNKTMTYWLGPLQEDQALLIDAWAKALIDGRLHWLNNRDRWTQAFLQALQHRQEPEVLAAKIHILFVTPQENWTREYRELSEHNRELTLQLLADLHNSRTPKQRDAERKRFAEWLNNLDRLASR